MKKKTPKSKVDDSKKKDAILKAYAKLRKRLNRDLSMEDFVGQTKFTKNMLAHHWDSISKLDKAAREAYPDSFSDIHIEEILSPKKIQKLRSDIANHKRFLITTVVTGCDIDRNAYEAVKNWENIVDGKALFLIASDPAHNIDKDSLGRIPKDLVNDTIIIEDTELNSNIFISTIKLSAKHVDPITGLERIGQRQGSFIYASPKQRLKGVATSNKSKTPHFLMTTGAITVPDYRTTTYMSNRTSMIAEYDHIMGGLIVEVVNDKIYHFRQIQFDNKGSFIDLGQQYNKSGKAVKVDAAAVVLGDWHSGETCPLTRKAWQELCKLVNPENLVIHDGFNGGSINHHEKDDMVIRAQKAQQGLLSLQKEIEFYAKDIEEFTSWAKRTIMVKSNHDEFLVRYLKECRYKDDPLNHGYALKLADAYVNDKLDPLRFAIEGLLNSKIATKIKWLDRDEDFIISKIQLGGHGDLGINGSKGSIQSVESAYGSAVIGHSHSPGILRSVFQVGTSTHLKLSYNRGASSWLNASCIVYPNGSRQLINSIGGDWRL